MQTDLQKRFNSVNAELGTLKSNVDNGGENKKDPPKKDKSSSESDDDDFKVDKEDRSAPKVNRNSSCDLNPLLPNICPSTHSNV